jgi:hypothetical protein
METALKASFIDKYKSKGEDKFYSLLLTLAVDRMIEIKNGKKASPPEEDLLSYYEKFLIMYRREGEELYLDIAKVFRRAAHKIYRISVKNNNIKPNCKFLHAVK